MTAVFSRFFRDRFISLIIYVVAGVGFLWLYTALYPYIKTQADQLNQLMNTYPESFRKAFGGETSMLFNSFEGYISTEMFTFFWPMLVSFLATATGALIIAGEIEGGTIEIVLSQPLSRIKYFLGKYLTGAVNLALFVFISIGATYPLGKLYDLQFSMSPFWKLMFMGFLFSLALYSIAAMFSTIFSDRGKVYFSTAAILIVMYVLNIVSALKESLTNLQYFSFLHYFHAGNLLIQNKFDNWSFVVFPGVIIICLLTSVLITSRRDISA